MKSNEQRIAAAAAKRISTILLVDDDRQLNFALQWILAEEEHFKVQVAFDGEDALRMIKAQTYDVVVTDFIVPKLRGDELYRAAVQARPQMAGRFVLMSGHGSEPNLMQFLAETKCECLGKPFAIHKLITYIYRVLTKQSALVA